jgi:GntR family transcriptional regulator
VSADPRPPPLVRHEREELELEEPAPILEVQHTVWDVNDQPMTFEVNIVPANRWATYDYPVAASED